MNKYKSILFTLLICLVVVSCELTKGGKVRKVSTTPKVMANIDVTPVVQAGPFHRVEEVAVTQDGKFFIIGNGTLISIWDINTNKQLRFLDGHKNKIRLLKTDRLSRYVASVCKDNKLNVWDIFSGKVVFSHQSQSKISDMTIDPAGENIVIVSKGQVTIKPLQKNKAVKTIKLKGNRHFAVDFDATGKKLIVAGQSVHVFEYQTGKRLNTVSGKDRYQKVIAHPDGKRAFLAGSRQVDFISLNGKKVETTFNEKKFQVKRVSFDKSGRYMVILGVKTLRESYSYKQIEDQVRIYDIESGRLVKGFRPSKGSVYSMAIDSPNKRIIFGGDSQIVFWSLDKGTKLNVHAATKDKGYVSNISYGPQGKYVVTVSSKGIIRTWNALTGKLLYQKKGHSNWIQGVAISPKGDHFFTVSNGTVKSWDLQSGKLLRTVKKDTNTGSTAMSVAPNGEYIVTVNVANNFLLRDLKTSQVLGSFNTRDSIMSLAIDPTGKYIIAGDRKGKIHIFNKTGKKIRSIKAHRGTVKSVEIHPNGKWIVSGGRDKKIIISDLKTGKTIKTIKGHKKGLSKLRVSKEGHFIYSASTDRTVRTWEISSGKQAAIAQYPNQVIALDIHPSGKFYMAGLLDKRLYLNNSQTGNRVASLYSWKNASMAITEEGYYSSTGMISDKVAFIDKNLNAYPYEGYGEVQKKTKQLQMKLATNSSDAKKLFKPLADANPKSFKQLSPYFAIADNKVYYLGRPGGIGSAQSIVNELKGADPASFVIINENYAKDNDEVYFYADFFAGVQKTGHSAGSFRILGNNFTADSGDVYFNNQKVDGADDSIHAINASYYKDEESIYYKEGCCNLVKLEDLEISDFEIVDSKFPAYAKGKKKYYYKGKVIEKSSTKRYMKFTILNDLYAKDRVRVYYKGEKHPIASASNLKLKKGKISDYFFQYDAEGKVVLRSIKNLKGFNKILTLDPENMEVLAHRAKFLYRKKEFAKALSDFNRVLEATPENTDLLLKRGRCYEQLGQSEKALADYRLVLKSNPNDYSVNILVTGALIMMKQLDEAKKSAAQAKKVKPSDYQPLVYLGHISFLQSKDETAKKHYRQAMKNMDFKEELKSTIQNDLYVFMKKIWRPQEAYNIVQWTNSYWSKHHGNDGW